MELLGSWVKVLRAMHFSFLFGGLSSKVCVISKFEVKILPYGIKIFLLLFDLDSLKLVVFIYNKLSLTLPRQDH